MSVSNLRKRLRYVQKSGKRHVALLEDVWSDWDAVEPRWKAKLLHLFEKYGEPANRLPPEQFKSEKRHSSGGRESKEIQVWAFKAFQQRLYGATVEIDGVPTFVCAAYDKKKSNRANSSLLKSVARKLGPYL